MMAVFTERFLSEGRGGVLREVLLVGAMHLTTHRFSFHAVLPPLSLLDASVSASTLVIKSGPVWIHRAKRLSRKRRVWLELGADLLTTCESRVCTSQALPALTTVLPFYRSGLEQRRRDFPLPFSSCTCISWLTLVCLSIYRPYSTAQVVALSVSKWLALPPSPHTDPLLHVYASSVSSINDLLPPDPEDPLSIVVVIASEKEMSARLEFDTLESTLEWRREISGALWHARRMRLRLATKKNNADQDAAAAEAEAGAQAAGFGREEDWEKIKISIPLDRIVKDEVS